MKKLLLTVLVAWSFNAMADGIICSHDGRAYDGNYDEVKLEKTSNGYDITWTSITAGMGGNTTKTIKPLATDLKCNIKGIIAYCYKSSAESGEARNSIATFKRIEAIELRSLEQEKPDNKYPRMEISVRSPLLVTPHGSSFGLMDQFTRCKITR